MKGGMTVRWYRIEFYDKQYACNKASHAFAIVHRIAIVERQYSTLGHAQAAADRMACNLRRNGKNVKQYDVTPL